MLSYAAHIGGYAECMPKSPAGANIVGYVARGWGGLTHVASQQG
jgi:hypothetical protein